MKISELELPQHLFAETTSPGGAGDKLIAPDMLVSWAEQGRGDAIYRLCHKVYERRLASINAWESDRIQRLEEELMLSGNDEDMSGSKYVNVKHYHTTLEDVVREAELNRASVKERMTEHQTALRILYKRPGSSSQPLWCSRTRAICSHICWSSSSLSLQVMRSSPDR